VRFVDNMWGQDWCDRLNEQADLRDLADEMTELNPDLGARIKELVS
jgi:hypothetical protein